MQIIECVPNFSEGRDDTVVGAIAGAIESVRGVRLLDVDKGWGANRTVMSFVGSAGCVAEAAFQGIRVATKLIDMRYHRGSHPRLGATDVCPFVPIVNSDLHDCAAVSELLGERVARELGVPVFLYGAAARVPERVALPDVRRGEYEGLESRFSKPGFAPDFGPPVLNEASGATIIGARDLLIAFNVSLETRSKKTAERIASLVRESGRLCRDAAGNILLDESGERRRQAGSLRACRAVGWFVEEYDCAQVSTNLIDYRVTSLHHACEEIKRQSAALGVGVRGSEIIGLVPLAAMLDAGRFYLGGPGPERELVTRAVEGLGLRNVRQFDPDKKILDYRLPPLG